MNFVLSYLVPFPIPKWICIIFKPFVFLKDVKKGGGRLKYNRDRETGGTGEGEKKEERGNERREG